MKILPRLAFCCVTLLAAQRVSALPLTFDPPVPELANLDRDGTLLVIDDLRVADFGGGLRLPVRWVYRSSDQSANPYGWEGFSLTLLEAKAVKRTNSLIEVTMLSGRVEYFSKGVGVEAGVWRNNDKQWTGVESDGGAKFTITRWDGWKMEFVNGRIKKLTTEDNRLLIWSYDSTDACLVTTVKESGHDPVVTIGISDNPLHMYGSSALRGAHTIMVNSDTYTFKYAGGTLQDIEFPDGRKTQWHFEPNGEAENEKRLTVTQETGWWKSWVFFDDNRQVKTDDIWSYTITGGTPSEDGVVYNRPTMLRTRTATGETEKQEYEAANSIETVTDVLGNVTKTYTYKTLGKLYDKVYKIERKKAGESEFTTTWRGTYDSETGDLIHSYDSDDNETSYTVERFVGASEFQPTKKVTTTLPLGRVRSIERNLAGDVIETVDTAGVVRKFEWDGRHRLTKVKNANNDTLLRLVYGEQNQILERYDALSNKVTYEYLLHLGEPLLKKIITPESRVTELTRDDKGRVSVYEKPSTSEWHFEFVDDWSAVEKVTDPLSHETNYQYDERLNRIKVTDALNRETETEYDDLDLPSQITNALNEVTKLEFNGNRDLTKLTDARNKVYTVTWDDKTKRKHFKWPDNVKQQTTYDAEGRVATYKPRGTDATVTNTWNENGELTAQTWTNSAESGSINLIRNSYGQISQASTTSGTLTVSGSLGYNGEGLLVSQSQTVGPLVRTATLTYDLNGSVETITYPAGFTVEYLRNGDGQITSIKKNGSTIASYTYDGAGRKSTRTLSNGVVTTYGWDALDRIDAITVTSGTAVPWVERYGYNPAGERTYTLKGTSGTVGDAYQLDASSQLIGVKYGAANVDAGYASASSPASIGTWSYDAVGNRVTQVLGSGTTGFAVNDINQYTTIGADSPVYSSRGDLAERGDWQFTYDAFGNLIRAHNTQTNVLAQYWTDAFGHRAVKDVDGSKTVFFNLGTAQIEAYDLVAETAESIIFEPGLDRPLAKVDSTGTLTFFHQDWLNNVVILTDAVGAKLQSFTYDAWGKPSGQDAVGNPVAPASYATRFLYTGRELDAETGLYHYRARAYSPELGRFAQFDPINFEGGDYNLLRYVFNNPGNYLDPFGLCSDDPNFWDYITESWENFFNWLTTALGPGAPTGMSELAGVAQTAGPMTEAIPNVMNNAQNKQNLINGPNDSGEFAPINPSIGNPGMHP